MVPDSSYRVKAKEFLRETRQWQSEASTWAIELMFLQRMLDIYGLKADDDVQAAGVRSLRDAMRDFLGKSCEELRKVLAGHHDYVVQVVEDRLLLQDRELPYKHTDVQQMMQGVRSKYHLLHQEAFGFIEGLRNL